ncbi:MAG: hypothetical protein IJ796_11205 [Lachnospiraceae bacterium]|nr:hypothetical protein [Lachnospiraceae bacterium]
MKFKPRATRITIIIVLLVMAVVGYYAFLTGRAKTSKAEASMTAIEAALSRNLDRDYPPTPKEVMKYYNDIIKCYYNEECSDDDIEALGLKARGLYDEKLLEANEMGGYLINLKDEVKGYRESKRKITNAAVASSTNVDFYDRDGYSFARLLCTYNVNENGKSETQRIVYLLRKDTDKHWKIYGWDFEANVDLNGDGIPGD